VHVAALRVVVPVAVGILDTVSNVVLALGLYVRNIATALSRSSGTATGLGTIGKLLRRAAVILTVQTPGLGVGKGGFDGDIVAFHAKVWFEVADRAGAVADDNNAKHFWRAVFLRVAAGVTKSVDSTLPRVHVAVVFGANETGSVLATDIDAGGNITVLGVDAGGTRIGEAVGGCIHVQNFTAPKVEHRTLAEGRRAGRDLGGEGSLTESGGWGSASVGVACTGECLGTFLTAVHGPGKDGELTALDTRTAGPGAIGPRTPLPLAVVGAEHLHHAFLELLENRASVATPSSGLGHSAGGGLVASAARLRALIEGRPFRNFTVHWARF